MRRFQGYRRCPPSRHITAGAANPPDAPQYEGVVFSDGTVCVRWLTGFRSHSLWNDYDTFFKVHGHEEEYGTVIEWLDP